MGSNKKTKIGFKFQASSFKINLWLFFGACFIILLPLRAKAVILYLMPQAQTIYEGESFVVEIRLNTEGGEINAVETGFKAPDSLEIVDFSEGNSILSLWPDKPKIETQDEQEISFIGGVPGGFSGEGLLLKVTLRLTAGQEITEGEVKKIKINLKEDSKVLLNDGKATLAELSLLGGNYEIIKKPEGLCQISSKSHPEEDKWYKKKTLRLHWNLEEGALYSYVLSYDPLAEPDDVPDEPEGDLIWMGDMRYDDLGDGIYYFHLKRGKRDENQKIVWGPKATLRAMIDTTSPEEFQPKISQDMSVFEGKYFLSFITQDENSGVDYYEIYEGPITSSLSDIKEEWKVGESPYLLEDQSLKSKILVKAVDKAGNERTAEILPEIKPFPKRIILILIGIGVLLWIIYVLWKKTIKKNRNPL